ncbi:MAG: hypothetical protein IT434_14705 [Phycisphaerales bacterium]|jgi:hypothetical protein|nr:hypothetical protein [Phycisphaerales bacterium]
MDFFIDRNVPERLARMLDCYDRENTVVYLDDKFDKTTPDTEWLREISKWSPIPAVISGDGRILKNPAELQVLRDSPLSFFLFAASWSDLPWSERAWKTVKVWPHIVLASTPRKPSIFEIPVSASKVELVCTTSELGRQKPRKS